MPKTDPELLARAKYMRANPRPAEARLWYSLRAKRFEHAKFVHQVVIGRAIADFVARSRKLVIEVDGDTHADAERDARRTVALEKRGYRVIRFTNADVMGNLEGVLLAIGGSLALPLPSGERVPEQSEGGRGAVR